MELIHRLQQLGFVFDLSLIYSYIKPDQHPPLEAYPMLAELREQKPDAILYLAEKNFRPQHIKTSADYRIAINKALTQHEALDHALACISALTGDSTIYSANIERLRV